MSYDITIMNPKTGEPYEFDEPHQYKGGTYAVGGETVAHFNITYNYAQLYRLAGFNLRDFEGWQVASAMPMLELYIDKLGTNTWSDYWAPTPGNAGKALANLIAIARPFPDGIITIS